MIIMIMLMYSLWIIMITAYCNRDDRDNCQVSTRLKGNIGLAFPTI